MPLQARRSATNAGRTVSDARSISAGRAVRRAVDRSGVAGRGRVASSASVPCSQPPGSGRNDAQVCHLEASSGGGLSANAATAVATTCLGHATRATPARPTARAHAAPIPLSAGVVGMPGSIADDLNWRPQLPLQSELGCMTVAAAACTLVYVFAPHPPAFSVKYASMIGCLFVVIFLSLRYTLLERLWYSHTRAASQLGDEASRFAPLDGTLVHYQCAAPAAADPAGPLGAHCYHGFGANLYSWAPVLPRLAAALGAPVSAHDMPGFGLTERPMELDGYKLTRNGRLGRMAHDAAAAREGDGADAAHTGPRRVLVGHSLGGICAAAQAVSGPGDVDVLVLVAPAIFGAGGRRSDVALVPAPRPSDAAVGAGVAATRLVPSATSGGDGDEAAAPSAGANAAAAAPSVRQRLAHVAKVVALLFVRALLRCLRPLLYVALRSVVRDRAFWVRGLSSSVFDARGTVSERMVDWYRLPQLVRGWEAGMCKFVESRVAPVSPGDLLHMPSAEEEAGAVTAELPRRLADYVRKRRATTAGDGGDGARPLRVLIVHGRQDALVPLSVSEALAATLGPGACELVVFERCGHIPHEEAPALFTSVVSEFVRRKEA